MKRELNVPYASAVMVGIIIGSGIFVSPISFTRQCGSVGASLLMWGVSGILSLMVAFSFTELGGMIPAAGGTYAFLRDIIGPLPAFLNAWAHLIALQPCFYALLAMTTTNYLYHALWPDCGVPTAASKVTSIWIIGEKILIHTYKV